MTADSARVPRYFPATFERVLMAELWADLNPTEWIICAAAILVAAKANLSGERLVSPEAAAEGFAARARDLVLMDEEEGPRHPQTL